MLYNTCLKYVARLCLSVTMLGCVAETSVADETRGVTDTEIVIGSIDDLSGPTATSGVNNAQALRLAFDQVNEKGGIHGRKIKFVVEDSQYQVPRAVQALNKMLAVDKIFMLVNNGGTPLINANLPTQLKENVLSLFPLSEARSMYEPADRLKFNLFASYVDQVRTGIKYFVSEKGRKNVCAMYQDTDYGKEVLEGVRQQTEAMGLTVTMFTAHKPADTDFNASVQRLRAANCDLVVLGTAVKDTTLILATARKVGWDAIFVGIRPTYDNAVASAPGGVAEGFYAISPAIYSYPDDPRPDVKEFASRYSERFGIDPSFTGQIGYGSAQIIITALEKAGRELTVDSFITALESMKGYNNLFGWSSVSFGPDDHDGTSETWLSVVKSGRWIKVVDHPLKY